MNKHELTVEEVKKIAKLAQLKLAEAEVLKFQNQLSEVLNYVEVLNELDTDDIEPTSQVAGLENVTRQDEIRSSLSIDESLSGASETERGMFATKAVFRDKNES